MSLSPAFRKSLWSIVTPFLGGMLLLPLVAKLLPFSLMPSAWDRTAAKARRKTERV